MKTENRTRNYTVRGLMRVWLAPSGMTCRPGGERAGGTSEYLYPDKALWE